MPTITVIVPVYKVEPYIHRCVDSILAQSFMDFELILVDDGSPDNCGAICDEYAEKDTRIHVIHQENGGLSAARNTGIDWAFSNSDSKWLAFVDSDDWVHPRYLELLYNAVQKDHTRLSVCEFLRTDTLVPMEAPVAKTTVLSWDKIFIDNNVTAIVAWNKLYAKGLFNDLRYPVGRVHEDEFLTYKLIILAVEVSCLSAVLYYYYQNPHGIMKSSFSLKRLDGMEAFEERLEYLKRTRNPTVIGYCVRSYLHFCMDISVMLREAKEIPEEIRQQKEREMERKSRGVILKYGLRYVPPWEYGYLYQFAFPRLYGIGKAILKPLFKMLKIGKYRNAAD